ncbi:hypothetical protein BCF33_0975 [Hasllibacter halocynthiae]|uniref:DUF7742 domain-containing protein n=1 Tax=Hasllibacter halocynthiae TaxID=595589 RepID=A0A2T0X8W2_9RHOB|nr:hypothetical protein [Hasllibacter halocynthiae]PRY95357.1 hypothetical protein BCF33_0975 [Hasllibacter halocynthiae]
MRGPRPLPGDLFAAAGACAAAPDAAACARRLRRRRLMALRWRARTGGAHPLWGDGSLSACARGLPRAPCRLDRGEFRAAMIHALLVLG